MNDVFIEQLVKKQFDKNDRSRRIYIVGIAIAVIIFLWQILMDSASAAYAEGKDSAGMGFTLLLVILIGIIVYIAYKKIKELNCEFEYSYTDGILDIDIIKNRSKRKKIFEGCVSEFEVMAHIDDKEHLSLYMNLPVSDYSSTEILGNTYVFVATYKGKKKRFIIEPKEELILAMRKDMTPRRLFMKK